MRWTEEEYAAYEARRRAGDGTSSVSAGALPPSPQGEGKGFEPNRRGAFALAPATIARETHPRPTKYGNRRVEIDGKKFDSQHEAEVYGELMLRQRAGELKLVLRQVPFELPGGIKYIADFVTMDHAGNIEVIDAKSEITRKNRVYINKKKQMASEWGIEIKEV